MESVSNKVLDQAVHLLGKPELSHEEVEAKLRDFGVKEIVAQRLASFIPEAFGMVAARHLKRKPTFLTTFSATNEKGESEEIPFSAEPIFAQATKRAAVMYAEGAGPVFEAISKRSSVTEVIQDAVNTKTFYEGAVVAIETGVAAEVYREDKKAEKAGGSSWKKALKELVTVEVEKGELVLWGLARWGSDKA